ncbi:MAG: ATP-binding protein, partial [Smithellaceae bacterium]|nr:ATP-binding protein [Smithellaceae bacterium]
TRIVFIGPCVAKKKEILDPAVAGIVDSVLTYDELVKMFIDSLIPYADLPESDFDGPKSRLGRSFPIPGGLLLTSGLSSDILENTIIVAEGKDRLIEALTELEEGASKARFYDLLFCKGCISGPKMLNNLSYFSRKEILVDYILKKPQEPDAGKTAAFLSGLADLDLRREFVTSPISQRLPPDEEIDIILRAVKKFKPEDQLDCGACGYQSCREKAIAVCQGLAETEMCLPYLVDKLEETIESLHLTNQELASAQEKLFQSEKLASLGQLSAGVAHEINNPLGTILLYSHVLLGELKNQGEVHDDLQMIVKEATRCRDIVRGLLNFARQSPIEKKPTGLEQLISDVVSICTPHGGTGAEVSSDVEGNIPPLMIDEPQIKQMLINLVNNGIDAISDDDKAGRVSILARLTEEGKSVLIMITDNGTGIPQEHLPKLFTPFFTTKGLGRGTGLGLAIAYGIIKMHTGDIKVESEPGKGTTVTIKLPIINDQ